MSTPEIKAQFLAEVADFQLTPDDISWHLNQTTAIDGVVDSDRFLSAFDSKKIDIATGLFEILKEDRGEFTLDDIRKSWDTHARGNPFLASNLAMDARPNPKSKPRTGFKPPKRWGRYL